jgi:hypothetical protein
VVEIADGQISIAGERVENETMAIRAALSLACSDYPALILRSSSSTDNETLVRVLREVAQAPSETIQLELGELHMQLRSRLNRRPRSTAPVNLSGHVRGEHIGLWAKGKEVGAFTPGNPAEEQAAKQLVQQACGNADHTDCSIDLYLYDSTSVLPALGSWQRVTAPLRSSLSIDIRNEPHRAPLDPKPPTQVSGRLPPPVIQRIVRAHFPAFRGCYEAGLGRDSKLKGLVNARFVIGRDGKVTNVSDHGSSLPDRPTVECILRKVYELEFPQPAGGIVTVIYPIMLQPEDEVSR